MKKIPNIKELLKIYRSLIQINKQHQALSIEEIKTLL